MNRPLENPPLDIANVAKSRTARRSPFWPVLFVLLVAVILAESQFDWGRLVKNETAAPGSDTVTVSDFAAGERTDRRSDYSDYLGAPIFLASRERIFLPDAGRTSPASVRPGRLGLTLLGTILSEAEPVAVMKTMPGEDVTHLRRGEELDGWTLIEIEGRLVRLQRADEIIELNLDPDAGAK